MANGVRTDVMDNVYEARKQLARELARFPSVVRIEASHADMTDNDELCEQYLDSEGDEVDVDGEVREALCIYVLSLYGGWMRSEAYASADITIDVPSLSGSITLSQLQRRVRELCFDDEAPFLVSETREAICEDDLHEEKVAQHVALHKHEDYLRWYKGDVR